MERKFLEEKNLDAALIDEIMETYKKDVDKVKGDASALKQKLSDLETELDATKQTLDNANSEITSYKNMDIDKIKKSAEDWKTKYETEKDAWETEKIERETRYATEKAVETLKFTSNSAKKAFINDLLDAKLPLQEGAIMGLTDYIDKYKKTDPDAFKTDETLPPKITVPTNGGKLPQSDGKPMSFAAFQKQYEQSHTK